MRKYDKEYIKEKMADFLEFRSALHDAGYIQSSEIELMLYSMWRH